MIFLLPPSETKRPGGVGVSLAESPSDYSDIAKASKKVQKALIALSKDPELAAKELKLGKRNISDLDANLKLLKSATMPSLQRYTGVLFDALDYDQLSSQAKIRADQQVFIQSSLFGLIPGSQPIPYYRLSANSKLVGLNLVELWTKAHRSFWNSVTGPVLDLRSKAYVALNPVPADKESFYVEVLDQDSGRALNHFNKKAKGAFIRSALETGLSSVANLDDAATGAGLGARVNGKTIELIVPTGF